MQDIPTNYGVIPLSKITKITERNDKVIIEAEGNTSQIITTSKWPLYEIESSMKSHLIGDCEVNVYHYNSDQLEWQYFLKDGREHLVLTRWMPDGTMVDEATKLNGKRHGIRKGYFADGGQLKYRYRYVNDKEHGICKEFYQHTGKICVERRFNMGKEKYRKVFDENGKLDYETKLD